MQQHDVLFNSLELPCGVILKNRIAKSAMSDSLGDGSGHPTAEQNRLYQRWAEGGLAVSIIGEVQPSPDFAEKPGNLVLDGDSDMSKFESLAEHGSRNGALLWLQLGHAGVSVGSSVLVELGHASSSPRSAAPPANSPCQP